MRSDKLVVQIKASTLWTKDHIKPVTSGGTNNINNIQPLCYYCNFANGNKLRKALKQLNAQSTRLIIVWLEVRVPPSPTTQSFLA